MKTLHILRSKPNRMVRMLIKNLSQVGENIVISLYKDKIDYGQLLKDIFESDRIISWW